MRLVAHDQASRSGCAPRWSFELSTRSTVRPYVARHAWGGYPAVEPAGRGYDGPAGGRRGRAAHRPSGRPC
ncbi:hypothetical protein HY68_22500 [Streptomyces sp. AcH 505]|nr:hypothetical protein HY68_22500 [Streptomyces sp. AcH 505]